MKRLLIALSLVLLSTLSFDELPINYPNDPKTRESVSAFRIATPYSGRRRYLSSKD